MKSRSISASEIPARQLVAPAGSSRSDKRSLRFRFYTLYDKAYRKDVLWTVYRRCLINRGTPGVDGQMFEDIEAYGVTKWLDELA